jgi:drug/metabolite transporter (DMT)-like permease
MTFCFGVQLVMTRRYPTLDMACVNAAAAAVCAVVFWPLASAVLPGAYELTVLALFGLTTTALAYLLFLIGARYIPSGEAGLIGLLDVVLSPLWVWLAFSEEPGRAALLGGAIVLAAVIWYLTSELRAWNGRRNGGGRIENR